MYREPVNARMLISPEKVATPRRALRQLLRTMETPFGARASAARGRVWRPNQPRSRSPAQRRPRRRTVCVLLTFTTGTGTALTLRKTGREAAYRTHATCPLVDGNRRKSIAPHLVPCMIMTMIVNSILSKMTRSLPTCLMGEHAGHIDKQRRRQHEGKRLPFPATQASGNW